MTGKLPKGIEGTSIELIVKDRNGKILYHDVKESDSFVANYYRILAKLLGCATGVLFEDVNGDMLEVVSPNKMDLSALAGDDSKGIVVGTGTTSPSPHDAHLVSKIANGTGSGQLSYQACDVSPPAIEGSDTYFEVTRDFKNESGADITVYEIGEIAEVNLSGGGTTKVLIFRHVESGGITVPNGATLTVKIKHKITT